MDYTTAVSAMQNYFKTQWAAATAIIWDDDEETQIPESASWVRFNVRHNDGFQSTMGSPGNNRFERRGFVTVQIFQKQGEFAIGARELAEDVLALYAGVTDSDIHYYDATIREIGPDGRGWFQINVIAAFRYDEFT